MDNNTSYSTGVSLTISQANALTYYTETNLYNELAAAYGGGWTSLTANEQTAIYYVAYNLGLHRPDQQGILNLKNNTLWTLLVQQDWSSAANVMAHMYWLRTTTGRGCSPIPGASSIVPEGGTVVAANVTNYSFSVTDTATQYAIDHLELQLIYFLQPRNCRVSVNRTSPDRRRSIRC